MSSTSINTCVRASLEMPAGEIIIVDDNEDWRDTLAAILELEGYVVTGFSDGASFLEDAADRTPICIFLDVFMPGPSGLEVLQKLAEIAYQAPIFLVSARVDAPVVIEALRNGALGVIEKPFDPYTAVLHVREAVDLWALNAGNRGIPVFAGDRFVGDARLTRVECAMLAQIAAGTGTERAARNLGISARAAAECRADVKAKFGARKFADLMGITLAEIAQPKRHVVGLPVAGDGSAGQMTPAKKPRRPWRRTLAGTHRDPT
jgi:two-component system, LuxR family, response regulator FixJ